MPKCAAASGALIELRILDAHRLKLLEAERSKIDPFVLSATIEAKIRAILTIAASPIHAHAFEERMVNLPVRTYAKR